jgi:hypothetical protein
MKKLVLIIAFVVLAAIAGYFAGYRSGPAVERQRSDMRFRVMMGQRLYQYLRDGETNRAMSEIRFVLWGDTVGYERAFGAPVSTDSFARWFAEAKTMTATVEPELRTNAQTFERNLKAALGTNGMKILNLQTK